MEEHSVFGEGYRVQRWKTMVSSMDVSSGTVEDLVTMIEVT